MPYAARPGGDLGQNALATMQALMTELAHGIKPEISDSREIVQSRDVADAVLQIAAAVDEWLQIGLVPPDRALHIMLMLTVVREYAVPIPIPGVLALTEKMW